MIPLYQLHPVAVHFPIVLLLAAALFKLIAEWRKNPVAAATSLWMLRLGAPAAVITGALGLLAARTAPHVPAAWETMYDHKMLGLSLTGTALALWLFEEWHRRAHRPWLLWLTRLLWLAVVVLVIATGSEGGELVYTYGVAVDTAPHI